MEEVQENRFSPSSDSPSSDEDFLQQRAAALITQHSQQSPASVSNTRDREEEEEVVAFAASADTFSASTDAQEGDSNGQLHLLNLAALTVQRDTPTRPTDALVAAQLFGNNRQEQVPHSNQNYSDPPERDYHPDNIADSEILVPTVSNRAYSHVFRAMAMRHPVQQPVEAAFSAFTDVVNNHFDWHNNGTAEPAITRAGMAEAFQRQSADGNFTKILTRFSDELKAGGHDDGSDGGGGGNDDSDDDDSDDDSSADDVGQDEEDDDELKAKKVQRNQAKSHHEASKGYLTLIEYLQKYFIDHASHIRQAHLKNRNECRTLSQKIQELNGKECGVSTIF